jgi:hypothetical protein
MFIEGCHLILEHGATSTSWDQADRMAGQSHDLEVSAISGDKCGTDRHWFSSRYPTVDLMMLAASTRESHLRGGHNSPTVFKSA